MINLLAADESHREFCYQVSDITMGHYAAQIPDWDEDSFIKYRNEIWRKKKPMIIVHDNQPIGTIFVFENENRIEIGQFYILPEYQNKGIGSYLLEDILDNSDNAGSIVELEVLKVNPAVSLYQRYGFEIVDSNEHMYQMERKPGNAQ